MDSFEFLSVLISVVVGLGMANLLNGIGRLIHLHGQVRISLAHLIWTLGIFLYMIVYWWTVVFGWQAWENWNILIFLFVLGYGVVLFLLSVVLYPNDMPESWDPSDRFIAMRRWFFGFFLLLVAFEFCDSYLKSHVDDFALPYLLMLGSWAAVACWGWVSDNRKVHNGIALFQVGTMVLWVGYQLRDLEWSSTPGL